MNTTPKWIQINPQAQYYTRDGAGALVWNDAMWVIGGWNDKYTPASNNEVWFSYDGVKWNYVNNAQWEGRHCAGYTVFQNKMWVIGGDNNTGHYQNDVWWTNDGSMWKCTNNNVPWRNRVTHYVLTFKDKLWVMGGQQISQFGGGSDVFNDVWSSPDGVNWTQVIPHAPWSPRGLIMQSVVFNNKMWVIGGGVYGPPRQFTNDVWCSEDGINWTCVLKKTPWDPRQYHSIIVHKNNICVLGGFYNGANINSVWYSPNGINWTQVKNTPWVGRHAASVYSYHDGLWIMNGSCDNGPLNDVWCFK
jgi:hypothetical protein